VKLTDLQSLLKESDIVSIHTLLSKETFHLIGEKELGLMKKTAIIVNTARGKLIDQKALYDALRRRGLQQQAWMCWRMSLQKLMTPSLS
jgi:phosphoglycerate dehydrogenase-like enzyme